MLLIYYSHSYRKSDDDVNEFFQELMLDESLTPSLDPPSDHLNSAKPERHLRGTDGMIAVLTYREPKPSDYIRYEISLGLRARKPLLVFVEDVLPDDVLPRGILQRRFSRRGLLREVRDHRHAMSLLRTYIGSDPPPAYQSISAQRRCVVVGASRFPASQLDALGQLLTTLRYRPTIVVPSPVLPHDMAGEDVAQGASLCIAVTEDLTPAEAYLLGATRSALTPSILLTLLPISPFGGSIPIEYQPRAVRLGDSDNLVRIVETEIKIFEEDYLELADEKKVHLYRSALLRTQRGEGRYSDVTRDSVFNVFANRVDFDMSRDKNQISNIVGPVNIRSRLDHVVQTVQQAPTLADDQRREFAGLIEELRSELQKVSADRHEDVDRVAKTAELVVSEAMKPKPNKGFLTITAQGLKEAAQAVADIAPAVLAVAGKVAAFVTGIA
jgi:hypothetical protein